MKIFNDIRNKANYRITQDVTRSYKEYRLEFNILKNIWIPSREWDKGLLNSINFFMLYSFLFVIVISTMFINIEIVQITGDFFIFPLIIAFPIYFITNDIIGNYSENNGELLKELNYITKEKTSKKTIMAFDENGKKLSEKQLDRLNK